MLEGDLKRMKPVFTRKRIKAVFFDVQGTLIDRERSWRKAFEKAVEEFAGRWDDGEFSPKKAADRYWRALMAANRGKEGSFRRKQLSAMKAAFSGAPVPVTSGFLDSLYRRTHALVTEHPVSSPGAREALARLSRHYRLGIISNSPRSRLDPLLSGAGLDEFFGKDAVFVPAGRGRGKPGKALFRRALATFGIQPGRAVMVGDSWRKDVQGAIRCGIHAVHLNKANKKTGRHRRRKPTVVLLTRFSQLERLFE